MHKIHSRLLDNIPVVGLGVLKVLLVMEVALQLGGLGGVGHLGVIGHRLDADHLALILLILLLVFHLCRKRPEEIVLKMLHFQPRNCKVSNNHHTLLFSNVSYF